MDSLVFSLNILLFFSLKTNKTLDFQGFSDRLWRRERDSPPASLCSHAGDVAHHRICSGAGLLQFAKNARTGAFS